MRDLLRVWREENELYRTLNYLYIKENMKLYFTKMKAMEKSKIAQERALKFKDCNRTGIWDLKEERLIYGVHHNSVVGKISKTKILRYKYLHRLRLATLFGSKLIIDLDYDQHMKIFQSKKMASQLGMDITDLFNFYYYLLTSN